MALLPAMATAWTYPAWATRGIRCPIPRWPLAALHLTTMAAAVMAAVVTTIALTHALAAATWAAVTLTAAACDWTSRKAPREPSVALIVTGATLPALTTSHLAPLNIAVTMTALTVIPWLLWLAAPHLIGFADILILTATTAAFAWWVPTDTLLIGLLLACGIALTVRLATRQWASSRPFLPAIAAAFLITVPTAFTSSAATTASTATTTRPTTDVSALESTALEVPNGRRYTETDRILVTTRMPQPAGETTS